MYGQVLVEAQLKRVGEVSETIPVLKSANMSLGVNTVFKLVAAAAKILAHSGYDIEIVEKHHNQKLGRSLRDCTGDCRCY